MSQAVDLALDGPETQAVRAFCGRMARMVGDKIIPPAYWRMSG